MEEDYEIIDKNESRYNARKAAGEEAIRYATENALPCRFCGSRPQISTVSYEPGLIEIVCECGYGFKKSGRSESATEKWNESQKDESYIIFAIIERKPLRIDFDTPKEAREFYMKFMCGCEHGIGYKNEFYPKEDILSAKLFIPFEDMCDYMKKGKWVV